MKPAIFCALPLISMGLLAGCGKSSNVQAAAPSQPGQATLIRTQAVHLQLLSDTLELSAKVQADPARLVHVFPPASGRVTAIEVRPGDRVRQGQTVAVLQSSDIATARADYEKARIESERSDRDLKRASLLFEHEVMPEKDYLDAKAGAQTAHAELARTRQRLAMLGVPVEGSSDQLRVTAPRPGVVLDLGAAPGELNKALDAQQPLLTIADLSHVWIVADVYERDLATVRPGATVEVSVNAYPGRVWSGRIDSVSGALDPATRTVKARIVLPNADLLLKPEMFATIRMSGGSHNAIQLPAAAVIHEGPNAFVFVRNSSGKYENRKVSLGAASGQQVEVIAGLNPGEQVVTEGAELLRNNDVNRQGADE